MFDTVDAVTGQIEAFRTDVVAGLAQPQKTLPSRWLYDRRGSELFEAITQLAEYYPTRTETGILRRACAEIADLIGPEAVLLEYGAGAGVKTEILLEGLSSPRLYVPVDISAEFLKLTAARLNVRFPQIETWPVTADFTSDFALPGQVPQGRRAVFFPGSTIGNLDGEETAALLARMRRHAGERGVAIIGCDLVKAVETLLAAYDDREGVTAAFNLNLLRRINRELGGNFTLDGFRHEARWNPQASAVEMHLVSCEAQRVRIAGQTFSFDAGETIHTESSRKYDLDAFSGLVERYGWRVRRVWTDPERLFAVCGLAAE